jgi:protein-tyrosine phosphatase
VSCLTPAEESELELEGESEAARSLGLEFLRIPIEDFGTPGPGLVEELLSRIGRSATPNARIAIHCRQGLGRSPLVAAAMLVRNGMKPREAWEVIAKARGRAVPETEEQRVWLTRFAAS